MKEITDDYHNGWKCGRAQVTLENDELLEKAKAAIEKFEKATRSYAETLEQLKASIEKWKQSELEKIKRGK